MNQSNSLTTIIIVAIVALGVGYLLGAGYFGSQQPAKHKQDTFEAGWQAAQERLNETNLCPTPEKVTEVEGKIKKVGENKIIAEIDPVTPLSDPKLDSRALEITKNAQILKRVEKSREQFRKEMKEFEQLSREEKLKAEPPQPFTQKEISFSELKKGQQIEAESVDNKNIKTKKTFEVSQVVLRSNKPKQ